MTTIMKNVKWGSIHPGGEMTARVPGRKVMTTSCNPCKSAGQMGNTDADNRSRKLAHDEQNAARAITETHAVCVSVSMLV